MNHPIWLIAAREFRAYVAATSFWIALGLGPLLVGAALLVGAGGPPKSSQTASLTLVVGETPARAVFSENFPLSDAARREVVDVMKRDGRIAGPVVVSAPAKPKFDAAALSRFALVLMLWLALVGSLGMLLQAVVRERANRALESLLAAAPALDVVLGKLAGVGAVSTLVLGAWLASAAGLSALTSDTGGVAPALLRAFADPLSLARAGVIYLLGFAFYGLATVAIGAMARDNADAQNLARPMFAVLLVVFFTAMAMVGDTAGELTWLIYAPPFTPFALLMSPQPAGQEIVALGLLLAATVAAGLAATRLLRVERVTIAAMFRRRTLA